MRIVLMSTRVIGQRIAEALITQGEEVVGIGSPPVPIRTTDRLEQVAKRYEIPFLRIEDVQSPQFFDTYTKLRPEINVSAALRAYLPESILKYPTFGTIGWHPSLLPKYAGVNSLSWAIIFGENKTANTVFWTDKGIDTGPILCQKELEISPTDTLGSLYSAKIVSGAVEVILEALSLIKKGVAPRIPQDLTMYSYYSFFREEDVTINWVQPVSRIYDLIRGINPSPGARTNFGNIIFKVLASEMDSGFDPEILDEITTATVKSGDIIGITDDGFKVCAPDGTILIKEVSFEGEAMKARYFAEKVGIKKGCHLGKRSKLTE